MSIITRFAPSPTGLLHLGHAYAAWFAWKHARQNSGTFLLRLEDIDQTRCRPDYAEAILEDLHWLGLDWDGDVRVQSRHMAEYRAVMDDLTARGLIYPCFCTRAEILRETSASAAAPHAPDGSLVYPGTCRDLPSDIAALRICNGERYALRLDMRRALSVIDGIPTFTETGVGVICCDPLAFGDVILARKDTPASYHLCVTHDDAVQQVTLVTRGVDLRDCTSIHRILQALMGWPRPRYAHHPLLTDESGRRLAKRDGARTLRDLRASGVTARDIRSLVDPGGA